MDNFAITAADAVSRRYKSNDPEAIIAQRAIKIKDIRFCEELLGFYTVLLNCEYIGINPNCSKQQRRSALAHELGHAIFDRKHAASMNSTLTGFRWRLLCHPTAPAHTVP